ncbi:uncharacterized protein LOC111693691 [Trichogramma pretiosum]|uniref:uncharacterized protein LOC111693691 n=1 Tax=Trichogramma pretiosum TaxID=7493 RepID=UPI000C71C5EC|nr:uncharacterized protein LOC111693691 [Trichogramma pretiosum]
MHRISDLTFRQPSKSQLRRLRKKETKNRHRIRKKDRIKLLKQLYHGQISHTGPVARARQAFEKEQCHQRKESQGHIETSQAVTEAQIRARRRVRATEKEHMQEQAQNRKLKQDYTNQWIARTFGTLAIKLPDEDIKRPTFPMCRIPADDVLQIHVQKWDQPN